MHVARPHITQYHRRRKTDGLAESESMCVEMYRASETTTEASLVHLL